MERCSRLLDSITVDAERAAARPYGGTPTPWRAFSRSPEDAVEQLHKLIEASSRSTDFLDITQFAGYLSH